MDVPQLEQSLAPNMNERIQKHARYIVSFYWSLGQEILQNDPIELAQYMTNPYLQNNI